MRFTIITAALVFSLGTIGGCSLSKSVPETTPVTSARPNNTNAGLSDVSGNARDKSKTSFGDASPSNNELNDQIHTPPKGSTERQAIMDGLRDEYNDRGSPVFQPHSGDLTFVVNFLKVHNGWAWIYAEPHSSDPRDSFGENSGFLLHLDNGKWKLMALPPMLDDPDDPENLDYPSTKDVKEIKQKYPSAPTDIFPQPAG